MEKKEIQNNYFPALTGIRAVSAYFVFLHHYNHFNIAGIFSDYISGLHIGVTMFFVLSGFLITYRYYDNGPIVFKNYFFNRFARIYPVYFLLTSATFITSAFLKHENYSEDLKLFLYNITFVRGFFDNIKFSGIAQGWSLTVEETFYLLAPLFFLMIKKSKFYFIIIPVCCIAFGLLVVDISAKSFSGFFDTDYFMFGYTFFGRCFEFFLGIMLAIAFRKYGNNMQTSWFTMAGVAGIFLCLTLLICIKRTYNYEYGVQHPLGMVINNLFLPLFGVCTLLWGLLTEKTIIQKFLGSRLMMLLGKSSYIFYLIHLGIICNVVLFFTTNILYMFIALNLISILLYYFIEEPVNIFLRRKWSQSVSYSMPAIV